MRQPGELLDGFGVFGRGSIAGAEHTVGLTQTEVGGGDRLPQALVAKSALDELRVEPAGAFGKVTTDGDDVGDDRCRADSGRDRSSASDSSTARTASRRFCSASAFARRATMPFQTA